MIFFLTVERLPGGHVQGHYPQAGPAEERDLQRLRRNRGKGGSGAEVPNLQRNGNAGNYIYLIYHFRLLKSFFTRKLHVRTKRK